MKMNTKSQAPAINRGNANGALAKYAKTLNVAQVNDALVAAYDVLNSCEASTKSD